MKKIFLILIISILSGISQAEEIKGKSCYHYSDNEALNSAREIAISMAKRDALEGYAVFVNSTSTVENFTLKNDLITSLTGGLLKNLKIVEKNEDLNKRKICVKIRADVEPIVIKEQITSKINAFVRKKRNIPTGLPENDVFRVLKSFTEGIYLKWITECKLEGCAEIRVFYYDKGGIPIKSYRSRLVCGRKGDIETFKIDLPKEKKHKSYSWEYLGNLGAGRCIR